MKNAAGRVAVPNRSRMKFLLLKASVTLVLFVLSFFALLTGDCSARELSTPLSAVSAAGNCDWDARRYFHFSHPGQFGFFPVKGAPFTPGSYFVFVGPVGKDGRTIPPRKIKTFGPKKLKGGHNYAAIMADNGETLRWSEDSAQLMQYSKPPKNEAVVIARNEADPAEWYAICLMPAGGAAVPKTPVEPTHPLHVTVTPAEHTMRSGEETRTTAKVSGGVPPYTYQWFNNETLSKVTKNSVRWTLRKGGTHIIKVIVTDSRGKTASAQSVIVVRAATPPPPPPSHVAPPKPPVTPQSPVTPPKPPVKKNPRGEWRCIRLDFAGNCIWQWVCNDLSNNCGPVPPKPTGKK